MMPKTRKINTLGDFVFNTICELPTTITNEEEQLFNSYPLKETVPVLQGLIDEARYGEAVSSRAFDALLKLEKFDQVAFMIDLYNTRPETWKWTVAERLSDFDESRSKEFLCKIATSDEDADARYRAVYSLYLIGGIESIPVLEHICSHDNGTDYEGNKIAVLAEKALERIHSRQD
ncbi:MAG: HEAT repeat domain-containing protein [Caldilineaceae bacterium]